MLQTKALYNLLWLSSKEDPHLKAKDWAVENLREVSLEDILKRVQSFRVVLDKASFCHFAEKCDTPEELSDLLLPDEAKEEEKDPFYLLVFELWRRLIPERQSLSIFCDELDHRIFLYDHTLLESDEPIQDVLANLLDVLEENVDAGAKPQEIFALLSNYCAHDLESFLYDYIADLLDAGNHLYASELVEGFSPYVADISWFVFLKIRLSSLTDIGKANEELHLLLEEPLSPDLIWDVVEFLSANGEHALFKRAVKKILPELEEGQDRLEVAAFIADFYRRLDEEEKEKKVQQMIQKKREKISIQDLESCC